MESCRVVNIALPALLNGREQRKENGVDGQIHRCTVSQESREMSEGAFQLPNES